MSDDKKIPWTQFHDMCSGGSRKLKWALIYIQAPKAEAALIFQNRFDRNPHRVTCACCGDDYSLTEAPTLAEASWYERRCDWDNDRFVERPRDRRKYRTVEEYVNDPDVLVIKTEDIKPEERKGVLRSEGYVGAE